MNIHQEKHQQPFLLRRAIREGTPFVENGTATFFWHGVEPPVLRGDFNDWSEDQGPEWQKVEDGIWTIALEFPSDAYIEYCFGPEETRISDPFNLRRNANGMGAYNSFFYMPEGAPTPLLQKLSKVKAGEVSRHQLPTHSLLSGNKRTLYLYQPPVERSVPLLVVFDGTDYRRRAKLTTIVDNLIANGRIQPIALAMLANGGKNGRMAEYACSESTLLFIQQMLLPFVQKELNLLPAENGNFGVMGASMGGLLSLFTGLRLPHIFGKVLSQSGGFRLQAYEPVTSVLVRQLPKQPLKIWLDVGRYEWLLAANEEMAGLLHAKGYDATLRIFNGGHNYPAWANDVAFGLEALFPLEVASIVN